MEVRTASCRCGALKARARGEPKWISVCHCLHCKARTGSAFSWNAHYPEDRVETEGAASRWTRTSDDGERRCSYDFCPTCGATAWYRIEARPGLVTIPAGNFADPDFGEPAYSGFGVRRCPWVRLETEGALDER
ncbi:MAG TPA: GFA family protein [Allosphingosinicella sp.]|nr:GFA family protein [Allosphingosinicella sp.]